jgi:hypothetical protein
MRQCVTRVEPIFNRAVAFKTSDTSYHGHPDPLRGAERRSLAVYYYRDDPMRKPFLPTTDYRPRPWEYGLRARRWLAQLVKG